MNSVERTVSDNVRRGLILLVGLAVFAVFLGIAFEAQIAALSDRLVTSVGPVGLGIAVGMNDFVISPVPPDLLLLVLSKSPDAPDLLGLVAMLGLCSTLGGTLAWFVSRRFGRPEWLGERFSSAVDEHSNLIRRYGAWAVGIAALTPVPFSVVCWVAGFVNLPFVRFAPMALLRVPRFIAYFLALVFSDDIAGWLTF
jgi:membrane protein YqaA with SNARE-associated domain